jgi:hypothetical protein
MNDSKPVAKIQRKKRGGGEIRYTPYAVEEHISHSLLLSVFRENKQEFKVQEQLPLRLFCIGMSLPELYLKELKKSGPS